MTDVRQPTHRRAGRPFRSLGRIYGFGSVFGKTIRDSRRATIVVGAVLGLLLIAVSQAIVVRVLDRRVARSEIGSLVDRRPADPAGPGRAGRSTSRRSAATSPTSTGRSSRSIASLWSILALSGTLAAEARRGSLEFVAATR